MVIKKGREIVNVPLVSIVMPVFNGEKFISEAIESILKQSFEDFELIIIDDGSEDDTVKIIQSFNDKRIVLLHNTHDFIVSLNKGLEYARGKYIARMDSDDIMDIDRLKIQHAIMEEESSITVCGSWMIPFGEGIPRNKIIKTLSGLIDFPIFELLKGNILFHPTTLIRRDFLSKYRITYENFEYAEDYKLWIEIAKNDGLFYIEEQPLLFYRISENQISRIKKEEQRCTVDRIKHELIIYLINHISFKSNLKLNHLLNELLNLKDANLIIMNDIIQLFDKIFLSLKSSNELSINH